MKTLIIILLLLIVGCSSPNEPTKDLNGKWELMNDIITITTYPDSLKMEWGGDETVYQGTYDGNNFKSIYKLENTIQIVTFNLINENTLIFTFIHKDGDYEYKVSYTGKRI